MAKKSEYIDKNRRFIKSLESNNEVNKLANNIFYKIVKSGESTQCPRLNSIVTVHYKGSLLNGYEFDNSWKRGCPEAFRLNQLIEGWQIAMQQMHVGDHWIIYIPSEMGYGPKRNDDIPGGSTLIFELELLGIG